MLPNYNNYISTFYYISMNPLRTALVLIGTAAIASANFDQQVAFRAMYYSGAAYCAKNTLDSWNCGEPCSANSGF